MTDVLYGWKRMGLWHFTFFLYLELKAVKDAEKKASAEAAKKVEEEKVAKAETKAIEAPAPAPAPIAVTKAPAPTPAPATKAGALGKVQGTAAGGKVLPKEEVSADVLNMLKKYN